MALVLVIGKPAFRVTAADAHALTCGYACRLDMTRRDLQLAAREQGRPWHLGKNVEQSSVVSEGVAMPGQVLGQVLAPVLGQGALALTLNGQPRQQSGVSLLIWNLREVVDNKPGGRGPGSLRILGCSVQAQDHQPGVNARRARLG